MTIVAAKVSDKLSQIGLKAGETFYLAWDNRELRLFVMQYVFEQTMKKNTYEKRCFLLAANHPGKQETSQKKGGEPRCS